MLPMIIDFHIDLNYQYINIDNIHVIYCNYIYMYIYIKSLGYVNFFLNKTYR